MKKLFGVNVDIKPLADSLGSDSGYMTIGGPAIISGRGDKVLPLNEKVDYHLLIISEDFSVSAKECYNVFDTIKYKPLPTTALAEKGLKERQTKHFKNDLYLATKTMHPEIQENINALNSVGATSSIMTGSGPAVYGVFTDKKSRDKAYKTLYPKYKDKLIKAKTI